MTSKEQVEANKAREYCERKMKLLNENATKAAEVV